MLILISLVILLICGAIGYVIAESRNKVKVDKTQRRQNDYGESFHLGQKAWSARVAGKDDLTVIQIVDRQYRCHHCNNWIKKGDWHGGPWDPKTDVFHYCLNCVSKTKRGFF